MTTKVQSGEAAQTIRVLKHAFQVPRRYVPGHVLTPGEAQALNGLLAENIRNNVDHWVSAVLAAEGNPVVMSASAHEDLAQRVWAYGLAYQFAARAPGPDRKTPLEVELQALVEIELEKLTNSNGGPMDLEQVLAQRAELLASPAIQALARERLVRRTEVARQALEELL